MFKWWPWQRKEETKVVHFPNVRVVINRENLEKLKSYVLAVNTEITGLGTISRRKNVFYISEIFLLDQSASGGGATLEPVAMSKLINKLIKEGKDHSNLKFWWHSHVNMGAFWSPTDDATCERFENKQFSISLVINKNFDYLCRLDLYEPLRIVVDKIPLEVHGEYAIAEDPSEEVNEKVRGCGYGYNGYDNGEFGYGGLYGKGNSEGQGCIVCNGKDSKCWYCKR